jgi:hypothetical protein
MGMISPDARPPTVGTPGTGARARKAATFLRLVPVDLKIFGLYLL